jgi:hypothetical protein
VEIKPRPTILLERVVCDTKYDMSHLRAFSPIVARRMGHSKLGPAQKSDIRLRHLYKSATLIDSLSTVVVFFACLCSTIALDPPLNRAWCAGRRP